MHLDAGCEYGGPQPGDVRIIEAWVAACQAEAEPAVVGKEGNREVGRVDDVDKARADVRYGDELAFEGGVVCLRSGQAAAVVEGGFQFCDVLGRERGGARPHVSCGEFGLGRGAWMREHNPDGRAACVAEDDEGAVL